MHDYLYNYKKVLGGSGEMFWKGGFPGISFEIMPGLENVEFDEEAFKQEVDDYAQGINRYLRLIGIKANSLTPQVADPTPHIAANLDAISGTIRCPKRLLIGTESAHLASTQDAKTWADRVNGRRNNHVTPKIILATISRLVQMGALPMYESLSAEWNDPTEVDPLVRAQVLEKLINAMAQYATSGLASLIPPLEFLTHFLELGPEIAQTIIDAALEQKGNGDAASLVNTLDKLRETELNAKNTTGANGPNGPRPGTGAKKESKPISTGQNGG